MPENAHEAVSRLYDDISGYYESANSFLTLGLDLYWRRKASRLLIKAKPGNIKILDACCGTGDFALSLLRTYGGRAEITAVDLNEKMLAKASGRSSKIKFAPADAAKLPFPDDSFDAVTVSFAARNLARDRSEFPAILREFARVLKKDGVFLNLETTRPENFIIRNLMKTYVKLSIFLLNFANRAGRTAYAFLGDTIGDFYGAKKLSEIIGEAGFGAVERTILCPGAVAVHLGRKKQ